MIKNLYYYDYKKSLEIIYFLIKILQFNYSFKSIKDQLTGDDLLEEIESVIDDIQNTEKQDLDNLSAHIRDKYIIIFSNLLSEKTKTMISYDPVEGRKMLLDLNEKVTV